MVTAGTNSADRAAQRVKSARRAFGGLQELAKLPTPSIIERDAAIQRFEYTTEACWKATQAILLDRFGVAALSPKPAIRAAAQNGLISAQDASSAMALIDDRNLTSHTYHEGLAVALFARLPAHTAVLDRWLTGLESA